MFLFALEDDLFQGFVDGRVIGHRRDEHRRREETQKRGVERAGWCRAHGVLPVRDGASIRPTRRRARARMRSSRRGAASALGPLDPELIHAEKRFRIVGLESLPTCQVAQGLIGGRPLTDVLALLGAAHDGRAQLVELEHVLVSFSAGSFCQGHWVRGPLGLQGGT